MQVLGKNESCGVPFCNYINYKVVGGTAEMIKVLYNTRTVLIFASGWPDCYHIIIEDGESGTAEHKLLNSSEIMNNFKIDISTYEPSKNIADDK